MDPVAQGRSSRESLGQVPSHLFHLADGNGRGHFGGHRLDERSDGCEQRRCAEQRRSRQLNWIDAERVARREQRGARQPARVADVVTYLDTTAQLRIYLSESYQIENNSHGGAGQASAGDSGGQAATLSKLGPALEFGGSSNPEQEAQEEVRIKAEQDRWIEAVTQAAEPVFTHTKRILQEAHVPAHAVETQIVDAVSTQDLIQDILEAAQAGNFGTVVVGRESLHGFRALFTSHVGDALIRQAHGLTVWVVE